ncbi:MAG: DUF4386 domain-containing protein [Thermoleophilia bacterium]
MTTERTTINPRALLAAGVLFLITFITSIPALWLFQPVLDDPAGYIAGEGVDGRILLGVVLETVLVLANIATAVVLYPVLRRRSETMSLGYVTGRIVESGFIAIGIIAVLGIVSLRHDDPGAGSLAVSLAQLKDWTFLLGPGVTVGVANGLILGYLMLRSGIVPRRMAILGLAAGPILIAAGMLVLFGVAAPGGTVQSLATVPEFAWELYLGVYLTALGLSGRVRTRRAASPAASGARGPRRAEGATASTP